MNETIKHQPHQYLLFEVTKKCQNDCVFCYNVWKEDENYPDEELSTEDALYLVEKVIHESGCKYMALTGGEPLLKPDIYEIASHISSKKVTTVLISNGGLLTKESVEKSMESDIRYFEISLHSHKEAIHDKLVGRKGSYNEAIDAIINIKELGGQVNTVYVATKENIGGFKEFVELNAMLRVDWILFNRVACGGSCLSTWTSLAPSPSELQHALDEGAPLANKYKLGLSAGVQIQPCLVDLSKYENVATSFCPLNDHLSSHTYFAIDPAGNLRMCNRSKIILGNLLEKPFKELIEKKEIKAFCKAIPDFCLNCKLAKICAGGCKADALSYYGNLKKPDPYLEMWKSHAEKVPI